MQKLPEHTQVRAELAAIKRQKIITAASEMFSRYGYANTRLDTVADQLGVTKQFIYSEFDSKAQLLAEICLRAVTSSLNATQTVLESKEKPTRKLVEFIKLFAAAVCTHQSDVTVFAHERNNLTEEDKARTDVVRRELDKRILAILQEGVAQGEFETATPRMSALIIQGMVSWMYVWYRPGGKLSVEEIGEEMASHVLAMVEARSGKGRAARSR